jgi:hypothetical protein
MIPHDSLSCYHSAMRHLAVLLIHFISTLARSLGPGGVRSSLRSRFSLKHQLLILNRSGKRSPNLRASDRILAGLMAVMVRPTRLLRSAIVLKPSTLLPTIPSRQLAALLSRRVQNEVVPFKPWSYAVPLLYLCENRANQKLSCQSLLGGSLARINHIHYRDIYGASFFG